MTQSKSQIPKVGTPNPLMTKLLITGWRTQHFIGCRCQPPFYTVSKWIKQKGWSLINTVDWRWDRRDCRRWSMKELVVDGKSICHGWLGIIDWCHTTTSRFQGHHEQLHKQDQSNEAKAALQIFLTEKTIPWFTTHLTRRSQMVSTKELIEILA